jgi:spore germination protein YaaH
MKLTSVKSMVMNSLTVGLVAGAVALAAPAKAQAQQFAVGVQFGSPAYGYGVPADYYARQRYEELCRQRAFAAQQAYARQQARVQHDAWERHEAFQYRDRRDRNDHRDWDRR